MRAVFQSVVIADWGMTEMTGEDWSYEDITEDVHPFRAADREILHRGGRLASLVFTSARKHESYYAAANFLARHVRSEMPRSAGELVVQTRDSQFGTVSETTLTSTVVNITGTRRVGITTFVTYRCRGTLAAIASET